jgi:heat-inducible transcriptional repressor
MIRGRAGKVLNYIISQYIERAAPVPSQEIADRANLGVSPATIRNDMAYLEREGYLIRPHTSAGCIPSDLGYRRYVESIEDLTLPGEEQRLISHTFHQAEREVESWVSLTASLLARMTRNVALVSLPKAADCHLKHIELIAVQDERALLVVVLEGAKVKQQLVSFDGPVAQEDLVPVNLKLNSLFGGRSGGEIKALRPDLNPLERQAADFVLGMMQAEATQEYQEPILEGWHFILNQPEFAESERMSSLMELVEQRGLLKVILPSAVEGAGVHVVIGKENRNAAIQNCSVVLTSYGLPEEATGTIAVVGPTRMPYSHTIPAVYYLSSILSRLVAGLYGRDLPAEPESA